MDAKLFQRRSKFRGGQLLDEALAIDLKSQIIGMQAVCRDLGNRGKQETAIDRVDMRKIPRQFKQYACYIPKGKSGVWGTAEFKRQMGVRSMIKASGQREVSVRRKA